MNIDIRKHNQLVRFFEKQAEWIGLSKNAGPVLAVLFVSKYETGDKIALEDLAEATSYSRSNVSLILTQLEALGIAFGEIDYTQTGRGRRRILYELDSNFTSLVSFLVKSTVMHLKENLADIEALRRVDGQEFKNLDKMLDDLETEAKIALDSFLKTTTKMTEK